MYVLAILRYRQTIEVVVQNQDAHRAYLRSLKDRGVLLASGPFDPRTGGALLVRVPDDATPADLDAIRDGDPFVTLGIAQYEMQTWRPTIGVEALDAIA